MAALVIGPVTTSVISPDGHCRVDGSQAASSSITFSVGVGAGGLNFFSRSREARDEAAAKCTGACMSSLELPTIGTPGALGRNVALAGQRR